MLVEAARVQNVCQPRPKQSGRVAALQIRNYPVCKSRNMDYYDFTKGWGWGQTLFNHGFCTLL